MKIRVTGFGVSSKPSTETYWRQVKTLKFKQAIVECGAVKLKQYLENGYAVILASYPKDSEQIKLEGIETKVTTKLIALDIDSKENPITKSEMIDKLYRDLGVYPILAYNTFSDTNDTRFRLIYVLGKEINSKEFKKVYKGLLNRYENWLDPQTCNLSRIWQGTNKSVDLYYNEYKPFTVELIDAYIKEQEDIERIVREENYANRNIMPLKFEEEIFNRVRIKKEYLNEVTDIIINQIPIDECISRWFGGSFVNRGDRLMGCCPLHPSDNKGAFSIFKKTNTYSCFTRCGSGNVLTLAYRHYGTTEFNSVVIKLMQEYNISIPEEAFYVIPQK